MSPTELWLPIGAAAFYLYDAALLLWQNELVFTRAGANWRVSGGTEFRIGARRVFLPQPLLAHRPHFLVRWSTTDPQAGQADGEVPDELLRALRPIGALNLLQVVLLCALPAVLWTAGAGIGVLLLFGLFYLLTVVALLHAFRSRAALGLSARGFWLQALDVLACAPFAANFARRLALQHGLRGEPLRFASRHFDAPAQTQLRQLVAARVREEMANPDTPATREQELLAVLARLGH